MLVSLKTYKDHKIGNRSKLMIDEPNFTCVKATMGATDDGKETQLRFHLYETAFDRIKDGMNNKNYFEVMCQFNLRCLIA